ncbi:MAG: hypothetical protein J6S89_05920 [Paludibacteraceae bacterium]|nr:hypothetical protein [Paludibacteraceae bacterium]
MAIIKDVLDDLNRFAEKCPERRIVCLDNDDTPVFINCVECDDEDEPWRYTLLRDEDENRDMTVARLLDCLSENNPDNPDPDGEDTEVLVRLGEVDYTTDFFSGYIFFEYTVGEEKVIAFRCGDEYDLDYDFMDDLN